MITARVVAEPAAEPISLEEAYQHLRVDAVGSDGRPDDTYIQALIAAARVYCENYTGLALAFKTYEVTLAEWPDDDVITLPHPPFVALVGVTISDDLSDNELDAENYTLDDSGRYATLTPVVSWPVLATGTVARVRYQAGYGDESEASAQVPQPIRVAMMLLIGHWYANREAVAAGGGSELPLGVKCCLDPYRVRRGLA